MEATVKFSYPLLFLKFFFSNKKVFNENVEAEMFEILCAKSVSDADTFFRTYFCIVEDLQYITRVSFKAGHRTQHPVV